MMSEERKIDKIGDEIVKCKGSCSRVENKPDKGIIPRGFILEKGNRDNSKEGVIVVGMNPGRITPEDDEAKEYIKDGSYESCINYMQKNILHEHPYFTRTRNILDSLGYKGPILWTEIVKCQSEKNAKKLPIPTIRKCVHSFLKKELSEEPFNNWIIFTLGEEAFKTCSLIFPDRKIIGLSHPSKANAHFDKFQKNITNNEDIKNKINSLEESDAIHLKNYLNNNE